MSPSDSRRPLTPAGTVIGCALAGVLLSPAASVISGVSAITTGAGFV